MIDIEVEIEKLNSKKSYSVSEVFKLLRRVTKERDMAAVALISISKNTCCDKCQEASLVAKKALKKLEADNDGHK